MLFFPNLVFISKLLSFISNSFLHEVTLFLVCTIMINTIVFTCSYLNCSKPVKVFCPKKINVIMLCVFFIYLPWTFVVSWCSRIFFLFLFPFQKHIFLLFMNSVQIHQGLFFCSCVCVLFPHFGLVLPFSSSLLPLYFWIFIKLSEFLLRMGPWLRSEPWLIGFRSLWRKSALAASVFYYVPLVLNCHLGWESSS